MQLPTIDDLGDLRGKRVLVRVDFNVPFREIDGQRVIADDFRIRAALPLFRELQDRGATVVACTHVGRPKGQVVEKYSVAPIREALAALAPGVELLENLRFSPGEEGNDPSFGAQLIEGIDAYVNEAFGASHREHASIMYPPRHLPSAAGPNLIREVETLSGLLSSPSRPFVAVVGGAKVADKLGIVHVLAAKADRVIIGGGMMFTFWKALGHRIGNSLVDDSRLDECRALLETGKILIPVDVRCLPAGEPFGAGGEVDPEVCGTDVPDGYLGLDIGPESELLFSRELQSASTVLWNGPMGVFEDPRLTSGTQAIADTLAAGSMFSVIGGGDSAAAVAQYQLADHMSFISTGGGASLELLEFGDFPSLRALREKKEL